MVACLPFAVLLFAQATGWYNVKMASDIVIWVLVSAEFISSIQNIMVVRTKKKIEEVDAVTFVLQNILNIVRNGLEKRLQK